MDESDKPLRVSAREVEQEAEAHLTLGKLLKKSRTPEKQEALRRILHSNISTRLKVEQIRRLDSETEAQSASFSSSGHGESPFRFTFLKLATILKLPHVKAGLLAYLFIEFRRIYEFGRRTHTLAPVVFLPLLRIDKHEITSLGSYLHKTARELDGLLLTALGKGWRTVSKREYNLIVAVERLCREILAVNFRSLDYRNPQLVERLRPLETLVLALHYRADDHREMVDALTRVLSSETDDGQEDSEKAQLFVMRILDREHTLPSLFNFIMIINMVRWRRFLRFEQIISGDLGDIINTAEFACDRETRVRIEEYVEELRRDLVQIEQKRLGVARLLEIISFDSSGSPDLSELNRFYQSGVGREEGWEFARDRENLAVFMPRIVRLFDAVFTPMLSGRLVLADGRKIAAFAPELFRAELERLRNAEPKLQRIAFELRIFTHSRYLQITSGARSAIKIEADLIAQIREVVEVLIAIAEKAERLRRLDAAPAAEGGEPKPLQSSALSDPSARLPYGDSPLRLGGEANERLTVKSALRTVAVVAYLVPTCLQEREFMEVLGQAEALTRRRDSSLEILRRLVDDKTYAEVTQQLLLVKS